MKSYKSVTAGAVLLVSLVFGSLAQAGYLYDYFGRITLENQTPYALTYQKAYPYIKRGEERGSFSPSTQLQDRQFTIAPGQAAFIGTGFSQKHTLRGSLLFQSEHAPLAFRLMYHFSKVYPPGTVDNTQAKKRRPEASLKAVIASEESGETPEHPFLTVNFSDPCTAQWQFTWRFPFYRKVYDHPCSITISLNEQGTECLAKGDCEQRIQALLPGSGATDSEQVSAPSQEL